MTTGIYQLQKKIYQWQQGFINDNKDSSMTTRIYQSKQGFINNNDNKASLLITTRIV